MTLRNICGIFVVRFAEQVSKECHENHVRERVTHVIYSEPNSEGKTIVECPFQGFGGVMPLVAATIAFCYVGGYL